SFLSAFFSTGVSVGVSILFALLLSISFKAAMILVSPCVLSGKIVDTISILFKSISDVVFASAFAFIAKPNEDTAVNNVKDVSTFFIIDSLPPLNYVLNHVNIS